MKRLIETVREYAATRTVRGVIPKKDVRALCDFAESVCGVEPFDIGSKEFNKWVSNTMPAFVEKDVIVSALKEPGSVVRIIFEVGRHYERIAQQYRRAGS